ncbi:MAG: hypothetical protein RJA22_2905, partial [Verrucomicrobiota bacterium]
AAADPRVDSWLTTGTSRYARLYETDADLAAGTTRTTWSRGTITQALPAYCGVQEVLSSVNWVYLRTTGLGSHPMGPWYLNAARTQNFPNFPSNKKVTYRIPRAPTVPATKTLTGLGSIGYFVDGVAMFDTRDGFVWTGTAESGGGAAGYWNRDAYVNEGITFDPALAHQPGDGTYHYHANPAALRHQLGDHVDYNTPTRTYVESSAPATRHSPILGWVRDGYPIYGPFGYSNATNPASGVRRMISGYVLRDGQNGTDNLVVSGRASIPAWAVRLYNVSSNQAGPAVSATYPLGRYMEDNAYLGDLGRVQGTDFDLDEYNGRFCVTPEFPGGTYAYFVSIAANGAPVYPYNIGRAFHGNPSGSAVANITEAVTTNFVGGPNRPLQLDRPASTNGTVTLTWSAVEGGTYRVEGSTNLTAWAGVATNVAANLDTGSFSEAVSAGARAYRVTRTALASYDSFTTTTNGGTSSGILSVTPTSAARGSTFTLTVNLDPAAVPALPPATAPVNSVTIGAVAGTSRVHVSQTQVTASFTLPAGAVTGPQTVTVVFPGPPNNPGATITYTLANGFTIN